MLKGNCRKKNLATCERKISSYKPAFSHFRNKATPTYIDMLIYVLLISASILFSQDKFCFLKKKCFYCSSNPAILTLRKNCPYLEFFLSVFRIFLYSDWIRRFTEYISLFSPSAEKYGPKTWEYGHFQAVSLDYYDINLSSNGGIGLLLQLCSFLD